MEDGSVVRQLCGQGQGGTDEATEALPPRGIDAMERSGATPLLGRRYGQPMPMRWHQDREHSIPWITLPARRNAIERSPGILSRQRRRIQASAFPVPAMQPVTHPHNHEDGRWHIKIST